MAEISPRRATAAARSTDRPIVIYDSGVGGLTVARHLARQRPSDDLLYVADNGWFPYGDKSDLALRSRVFAVLHTIVEATRPRAIVVACNTASTAVATTLDDVSTDVAFFTVVPPIEEAVRATPDGRLALLATPNTVRRSLVRRRIVENAHPGQITCVASMALVHLAERKLAGEPVGAAYVREAMDAVMPASERQRIEGVILGCTHFPWLLDELRPAFAEAHWWSDPARAVANSVANEVAAADRPQSQRGARTLFVTSRHNGEQLRKVFARHGFGTELVLPLQWAMDVPSQRTDQGGDQRWLPPRGASSSAPTSGRRRGRRAASEAMRHGSRPGSRND